MSKPNTADIPEPDPFDVAALRLTQDFEAEVGVERALVRVPVRKPHRQEFVRTHPHESYRLDTALVELHEDREHYLVAPTLRAELFSEIIPVRLYTAITRQGTVFLWPCKLPSLDGRRNGWHETALTAAALAMERWVRVAADLGLGGYQVFKAAADLPEPTWPDHSFQELLRVAFKERLIDRADHPVLCRLRGEA